MSNVLYNDYKLNYNEYMKTVLYTEKILYDNNSDQNKLIKIYEKAIKSAENMFKRMQLEVETNPMLRNKYEEFNEMQNEITECKRKLRTLKEEIMKKDQRNGENNHDDDRMYLLNDVDLLEKGDVYINQSKILMDNTEYIGNDVMRNLNTQKETIKKNITNMSFVSNNLDNAKQIMKYLKYKDVLNKYRLYIIYIFIILTFLLIVTVKYNRYAKQKDVLKLYSKNGEHKDVMNLIHTQNTHDEIGTPENHVTDSFHPNGDEEQASSVYYDLVSAQEINGKEENMLNIDSVQKKSTQDKESIRSGHDGSGHDENKHDESKHDENKHDESEHDENGHDKKEHDKKKHDKKKHDEKERDKKHLSEQNTKDIFMKGSTEK